MADNLLDIALIPVEPIEVHIKQYIQTHYICKHTSIYVRLQGGCARPNLAAATIHILGGGAAHELVPLIVDKAELPVRIDWLVATFEEPLKLEHNCLN